MSDNQKKDLAKSLKNRLNSSDYIAMPDLITEDDGIADLQVWLRNKDKKEKGWIGGTDINPEPNIYNSYEKEPSPHIITYNGLEPNDWEEIIDLIEKRSEEKRQLWETKFENIKQKLNNNPNNLYYYWGRSRKKQRADCWNANGSWATFLGGNGNGLTHYCYIAEEHSVLDNFSFQTCFYLIDSDKIFKKATGHEEGGFRNSGGETNPFNWQKHVEVGDKITITPCQVKSKPIKNDHNKRIIGNCNKCGIDYEKAESWYYLNEKNWKPETLEWFCGKCWQTEEKNYRARSNRENPVYKNERQKANLGDEHDYYFENGRWISLESGTPDPNTTKQNELINLGIKKWLVSYFQKNNLKEIRLENGKLIITNNENKIEIQNENDPELKTIQSWLQRNHKNSLNRQDLNISNSPSQSNQKNPGYTPYVVGGLVGIGLTFLVVVSYYLGKKRGKKNVE